MTSVTPYEALIANKEYLINCIALTEGQIYTKAKELSALVADCETYKQALTQCKLEIMEYEIREEIKDEMPN